MKSQQSTNAFVKEMFMDLKTQLETVAKNYQALIQNLETKFDRLADKQSSRPSGSLPSNTQPNPKGHNSKAYQPSIDVIDEILEEDFDALLDEGSKILHSIEGTLHDEEIFTEFDVFMAMNDDENFNSKFDTKEPPFEKITINIDYKIKTSLEETPTDLELKPLPNNLEYEVVKKEIVKLLDTGIIYPIADSPWVSPTQCMPKKGGIIVIINENDELVPTRTVTGWRVCIDYRKLNEVTTKDHFPLPFMDQMLERHVGNKYFCFLDGFFGYFQIPIDPNDQEKTTFACPFGTYAYRRMPFGLCNAPATFMDDFSIFRNSFDTCLNNLDKMLQRCKDSHLVLNWEKCHFMVKEGIILGHKVSSTGLEVDKAKIYVISKLLPPTNIKGVRSVLGHAGFYRCFIKDFSKIARPMTKLLEKVEIEHRAYWALKNCNPDLIAAGEKRMFQLHELDELRHQAYENSRLYKERTKILNSLKLLAGSLEDIPRSDAYAGNHIKEILLNLNLPDHSISIFIMAKGEIDNLTMEQYLALTRGNQAPSVVKPEIGSNVTFEIKSQFMRELREDTFSRNKNVADHSQKAAKRWMDRLPPGTVNSWDLLKKSFIQRYCPPSKIVKQLEEICNFKHEGDETSYQAGEQYNNLLYKCATHDLNNHQKNVYAIQVGCQNYGGAHLDKDCPLKEEVKSIEEAKYGEFGRPSPFSNEAKYHVGPPRYYTRMDNRPPIGEKRPSLEELMNKHLEESTRRRTKMEE
ncbi:reverse transcriptase domain-containing protein [Tanacetum coccineum]